MEHISSDNRRLEGEGEEIGSMEYVPAEEPLQPGCRILKLRVWIDGRVPGTLEDCFRGLLYSIQHRHEKSMLTVRCRPQTVQHQIQAIWR